MYYYIYMWNINIFIIIIYYYLKVLINGCYFSLLIENYFNNILYVQDNFKNNV
jgi:hypothetical protein